MKKLFKKIDWCKHGFHSYNGTYIKTTGKIIDSFKYTIPGIGEFIEYKVEFEVFTICKNCDDKLIYNPREKTLVEKILNSTD